LQDLGSLIDSAAGLIGGSVSGQASPAAMGDAGSSQPVDDGSGGLAPAASASGAASPEITPSASTATGDDEALDIELTDVRLVDAGSLERNMGPRYRLFYRNNGTVKVPKFHVSVAVDIGKELTETAEVVTVEAVGVRPGKSQTVDVRLPVEVLKMATDNEGRPTAFSVLAAVIDSDGDLAEVNTDNNILVFAREKIKSVKQ
jgi:hypothetical protein